MFPQKYSRNLRRRNRHKYLAGNRNFTTSPFITAMIFRKPNIVYSDKALSYPFYVWIISSTFSLCLESFMVRAPAVWVAHIQVDILLCYPTLAPLHLGILDYVSRKIPRFALATNTAPPALSWCRHPWLSSACKKF